MRSRNNYVLSLPDYVVCANLYLCYDHHIRFSYIELLRISISVEDISGKVRELFPDTRI